ncbi:uncharacterized protein BKCO1_15000115 [Diplodia corticola]|uniref:Uncharacterized protein n=1 Tax=Diplodia corticola TaxID=236234 RepID=A0A1J9R5K0_9PEZI|nr:uncharacterized protein BKCO1_15000115 [Diplodia corticola]OJD35833.1 hypothetical protein BKCO1_15000115 [Diplodia corticola]
MSYSTSAPKQSSSSASSVTSSSSTSSTLSRYWTSLVELFSFFPANGTVDAAAAKVLRCKYSGDEDLLDVEGWEEADDLWRGVVVGGGVMSFV